MDHIAQIPFVHRLPMTRIKIFLARILYRVIRVILRTNIHIIRRNGVFYEADLSEGIDLSLFVFGIFQSHILSNNYVSLPPDAIIFDIGANIGSMSFSFAMQSPHGIVYAFEPTDFAFSKLIRNLSLNPAISTRIIPVQLFINDHSTTMHQLTAYSSWKVDGSHVSTHPLHGGTIQPANQVPAITLDDYCQKNNIHRVDMIKIDTDGHEHQVLRGACKTIEKHHPYIIFEMGLSLMEEFGFSFEECFRYFSSLGYTLLNCKNGKHITMENYYKEIPWSFTIDIVAIPTKRSY